MTRTAPDLRPSTFNLQPPLSPDRRKHRGPHPRDESLFSDADLARLRQAVADYSLLLGRGYAPRSSLKLVGDRYALRARQRTAVRRASASDREVAARRAKQIQLGDVESRLLVDGFNLIVTVEAALAGGVLLRCRDGTIRDLASMHGSYRKVAETKEAIALIAGVLQDGLQAGVRWLLDRPVSNAGRLANRLRSVGRESGQDWEVSLADKVDELLIASPGPVASSDSRVLDGASRWVNLVPGILPAIEQQVWLLDLGVPPDEHSARA